MKLLAQFDFADLGLVLVFHSRHYLAFIARLEVIRLFNLINSRKLLHGRSQLLALNMFQYICPGEIWLDVVLTQGLFQHCGFLLVLILYFTHRI